MSRLRCILSDMGNNAHREEPESTERAPARRGRASGFNTPNRYEQLHLEEDASALEEDELRQIPTQFFHDTSRSILAKNDSPDISFTYSINPYRGCEHGCIYCYARPSHEYLGFSAGLDFESKILVKKDAPELLEAAFRKKSWIPQVIAFSGNTDPYQPIERKLQLTRRCLEVFLKFRNPLGVITKNHLITRDIDILSELAKLNLVRVAISITSLKPDLIGKMEPRTSRPALRLKTIRELTDAGIPVGVNAAPIIPGLTEEELPAILKAAADHGAISAGYIMVRLPGPVRPLFLDWIEREFPDRVAKITHRVQDVRKGRLSDSRWGLRMRGEGELADLIANLFKMSCEKYGLNKDRKPISTDRFRLPEDTQLNLF